MRNNEKEPPLNIPVAIISDVDIKPKEYYIKKGKEIPNIEQLIENKRDKLEKDWNNKNPKIFIAKRRTLEYDIALGKFQKDIFLAILIAQKIKYSTDEDFYHKIINDKNEFVIPEEIRKEQVEYFEKWTQEIDESDGNSKIAYKIYEHLTKKKISKSITAQIFSEIVSLDKEKSKELILADEYLKYIVDAINHASKTNFTE